MSILFGLYKPEKGVIKKDGQVIKMTGPKDANKYKIDPKFFENHAIHIHAHDPQLFFQ